MLISKLLKTHQTFILIGGYVTDKILGGKVTVILGDQNSFHEVVKVSRRKGKSHLFRNEYKVLGRLSSRGVFPVPKTNFLKQIEGYDVFSQSYLEGRSFSQFIKHREIKREVYLDKVFLWLKRLQENLSLGEVEEELYKGQLRKNLNELSFKEKESSFLLRGKIGRFTLCHGDLDPKNILFKNNQLSGIVDWEPAHTGSFYEDPLY